ncbi:MAG: hypothetical protein ACHP6H_01275 [Legionellales bacterium]
MKRINYNNMIPKEEYLRKQLKLTQTTIPTLLPKIADTYPNLQYLNLSNCNLDDSSIDTIINQCKKLGKLEVLDISDNFFSSNALALLMNEILEKNKAMTDENKHLELVSDYTQCYYFNLPFILLFPQWALTSRQWPMERNTTNLFEQIAELMNESDHNKSSFTYSLINIIGTKNFEGVSPLICALQNISFVIPSTLIFYQGIEWFHKSLMDLACEEVFVILKERIPSILSHYLLYSQPRIDLARQFMNTYLPQDSAIKDECRAKIAEAEGNYKEAYDYYIKCVNNNRLGCYLNLATLREKQVLPEELPMDRLTLINEYKIAAESGSHFALLKLIAYCEIQNDLFNAYEYLKKLKTLTDERPGLLHRTHPLDLETLERFNSFRTELDNLLKNMVQKRTALCQQRFMKSYHSPLIFKPEPLIKQLSLLLGESAGNEIIKSIGVSLMSSYRQDKAILSHYSNTLTRLMDDMEPNHDLLSMEGPVITRALIEHLTQLQYANMHMKTEHASML